MIRIYQKNVTRSPRAREAEVNSDDGAQGRETVANADVLPLLGHAPPPRCAHPHAHAWCNGRVHVPRALHVEFLDRLGTRPGETRADKAGRLIARYAADQAQLPGGDQRREPVQILEHRVRGVAGDGRRVPVSRDQPPCGARPPRLSRQELADAAMILTRIGYCRHEPGCETREACVRKIALARKAS